jgi:hypothetical protein
MKIRVIITAREGLLIDSNAMLEELRSNALPLEASIIKQQKAKYTNRRKLETKRYKKPNAQLL